MKKYKYIFVGTILLLMFLFFWFQIRPMIIRQNCQEWAYERANEYFQTTLKNEEDIVKKSQLQDGYLTSSYNRCLHDRGLAK